MPTATSKTDRNHTFINQKLVGSQIQKGLEGDGSWPGSGTNVLQQFATKTRRTFGTRAQRRSVR